MFGSIYFGQVPFAGVVNYVTSVVASAEKGWPFDDNLSVPDASRIPQFTRVQLERQILDEDEEDLMQIIALWLNRK